MTTTVGSLGNQIAGNLNNLIFGDPLLTAIFVVVFMSVVFYKWGVSRDGALVVLVPLILLFASYSFFPEAVRLMTWLIIGIMVWIIFTKLLGGNT